MKKCDNCVYGDICGNVDFADGICSYYLPVDDVIDECIEETIERNRNEFTTEWFEYIDQYN